MEITIEQEEVHGLKEQSQPRRRSKDVQALF